MRFVSHRVSPAGDNVVLPSWHNVHAPLHYTTQIGQDNLHRVCAPTLRKAVKWQKQHIMSRSLLRYTTPSHRYQAGLNCGPSSKPSCSCVTGPVQHKCLVHLTATNHTAGPQLAVLSESIPHGVRLPLKKYNAHINCPQKCRCALRNANTATAISTPTFLSTLQKC